jgi:hypothetical protein
MKAIVFHLLPGSTLYYVLHRLESSEKAFSPRKRESAMVKRFQVIQGGKDRDKGPGEIGPRLFRAYSTGNFAKGEMIYNEVRFNWYCLERARHHLDYSTAIADHAILEDRERRHLERTVERYFSEIEVDMLRDYLATQFNLGLEVEVVPLPIRERSFLFEEGSSVIYDFLELSERKGYNLPFKVWGYYTLAHSLAAPSMQSGLELLRKTFEELRLSLPISDDDLRRALSRIYREHGLFVKRREFPA